MNIELVKHIIDRFAIHFAASTCLVLMVTFAIHFASRQLKSPWLPVTVQHKLVMAALLVFAFSTIREAVDVYNGQPLVKAFTDYLSWFSGTVTSAWGLYRFWRDN